MITKAVTAMMPTTTLVSGVGKELLYEMTAKTPTMAAPTIGHFTRTTHPFAA